MTVLDLSAYKPVPATLGDANQIANGFQAIVNCINALDNNNFGAGKIFDPLKLMQDGAVAGQALVWSAAANGGTGGWVPGGVGATSLALNVGGANTDLAAPGGTVNYEAITVAGGTLRSIGAGSTGAILTLKNATAAGFVRLLHATAGGAGAQLSIIGAGHKFLGPGQTIQFVYDGTNWQEINRPGKELICDVLLTGAQAVFDTDTILGIASSLPAVYTHLEFVLVGRTDAAVQSQSIGFLVNNDVTGSYNYELIQGVNGVASAVSGASQLSGYCGEMTGASATGTWVSSILGTICDYKSITLHKNLLGLNAMFSSGGPTEQADAWANAWKSTAAINRFQLHPAAGNFTAGTRFSLYGIT